jgi:hypothetical protein
MADTGVSGADREDSERENSAGMQRLLGSGRGAHLATGVGGERAEVSDARASNVQREAGARAREDRLVGHRGA